MKLSILVPTLNEPYYINGLGRLKSILDPQIDKYNQRGEVVVEMIVNSEGRSMPTGTKRNQLIKDSTGEYFSQVDCDDVVPEYYVDELMAAISHGPDVISFIGDMYTNGGNRKPFTIKLGSGYYETPSHYYRFCNHLCCYKRSVVEHVKFPPIWVREDYEWAVQVQRLLKSEVHINKHMYSYMFDSTKNNTHYVSRKVR